MDAPRAESEIFQGDVGDNCQKRKISGLIDARRLLTARATVLKNLNHVLSAMLQNTAVKGKTFDNTASVDLST